MSYLKDVDDQAAELEFGELQFSLKKHNGKVTKLSVNRYGHHRFKDNTSAVAQLLQAIKSQTDTGLTGSISFTLMLKNGKIEEVIEQGYESIDYK